MGDEARKLLGQANGLDPEEFCTRAFVLTSEGGIINKNVPLGTRYQLAFELLQTILKKPKSYAGGQIPDVDYYDLLGIDESATQEEIEEAYKQKKASLQPDVYEKELRARGLSEEKIKERLANAKTTLYYVEDAHAVLGNEERRDHYHEHLRYKRQDEWKDTLDRKQKKAIDKKAGPINHGKNWKLLDVTPGATQLDLRTAYLVQVREHDPERYLQQLGRGKDKLTPEEIKEYNIRQERWSNINRAYAEELDEVRLKAERKERKSSKSGEAQQNIIITATPTIPAIEPSRITINFREKVIDGTGKIVFTPEETMLLISEGVIPPGTTSEQLSASAEIATKHLLPLGVDAQQFSDEVDRAAKNNLITKQQEKDLQLLAWILETEQKSNPELADAFKKEAGMPNVSITTQPAATDSPQTAEKPNQISLQTGDNGFLKPLFDKGVDFAKDKAGKLLEKTGVGAAKNAVKKFATDSLKKVGKELIKQGSKIAVKAGLTAAGAAASLGTSLLVQAAAWIGSKILKPLIKFATKAIRGLLKFITGKDDLKSQLKELSGVALAASLATGAVVPAVIAGGVFFSTIGAGSIIGSIGGVASAVFFVITSTVLAVSAPIIVGIVSFVILVIFITFIINNSAFVVPYGGINVPPGQSPPPGSTTPETNPYIKVTKIATSPDGESGSYLELDNPTEGNPITITYTIEITALDGDLTNITVNESCTAQGETPNLECPRRSSWIPPLQGEIIASDTTFTIEYTREFRAPEYWNSLITDRVTVIAAVEGETSQTASATAQVCFGDCPGDCPHLWPVLTGVLTQGPEGCWSHEGQQAVDISGANYAGTPVYATHGGTVSLIDSSTGGSMIRISGSCAGIPFVSEYAHLGTRIVGENYEVRSGEQIGTANSGGDSTGNHLHYEFVGLPMAEPYIPEPIEPVSDCCTNCRERVGCENSVNCTTTIP